jgi:glycine cleavage system regulatory protein
MFIAQARLTRGMHLVGIADLDVTQHAANPNRTGQMRLTAQARLPMHTETDNVRH